jgi:hypothetical protein
MKKSASFPVAARAFWRNWGVAGFAGLVLGLGFTAMRHVPFLVGVVVFGLLCALVARLLEVARRKPGHEKAQAVR